MKKKLIYPFLAVTLSFLLGSCSEQITSERDHEVKEATSTPLSHWSYDEDIGPEHWGKLGPRILSLHEWK